MKMGVYTTEKWFSIDNLLCLRIILTSKNILLFYSISEVNDMLTWQDLSNLEIVLTL